MAEVKNYIFRNEKNYKIKSAKNNEDYKKILLGAEKFINSKKRNSETGIYWGNKLDISLYSGSAGIVYYYLKLYDAFKEEKFKNLAEQGLKYLSLHWKDILDLDSLVSLPGTKESSPFGLGGIAFVFIEAWKEFKQKKTKKVLKDILQYYLENVYYQNGGAYWSGHSGVAMDGSIILLLIDLYNIFPNEEVKETIIKAGNYYLTEGKIYSKESMEYNGLKNITPFSLPNFEFGTSGSGFVLASLYKFTLDKKFLNEAIKCANFLNNIAVPQKKGVLIPYYLDDDYKSNEIFYLGTCHGPAGTSKFYYLLFKITKDKKWLKEIENLIDGFESLGAPEHQSKGLWNNFCLCCGHAGLLQFFIGLYKETNNERYHSLAIRCANVLLGEKKESENLVKWPLAWERVHPDNISAPIGYYDGAAGISAALLQLYLNELGKFKWLRLPDDPFPIR